MSNPYELLGVSEKATDEQIKAAYRKLSKKYHPDLNPGNKPAEQKFKDIHNAFDLVCNKECREKYEQQKEYDDYSSQRQNQQQKTGRQAPFYYETQTPQGRYSENYSNNYDEIFSNLFGNRFSNSKVNQNVLGKDVNYTLTISFEEAVLGAEKEFTLSKGKTIKAKIPPAITEGKVLRFKGQGSPDSKKQNFGDAYVEIHIAPSSTFKQEGNNLLVEVPITIYEAILGAKIEVPIVGGKATLTVPAGVSSGTKLRMKNKGYRQKAKDNHGDQTIKLIIELPDKIDDELSLFMKSWETNHPYQPRK